MIRLIVGLGNPGPEYTDTRHNAGFWWVDAAADALRTRLAFDRGCQGQVARVSGPQGPLWLLQPMTFMNLSGQSVSPLARFYKIAPPEILVVHDELDLPAGDMRLKQGGSAAGHKGLKDIQAQLGADDFWRLRLGIGHPGHRAEVAQWVLRKPPQDERSAIDQCIDKSMQSLHTLLAGRMAEAMMALHAKPPRPKPPRRPPAAAVAPPSAAANPASSLPQPPTDAAPL